MLAVVLAGALLEQAQLATRPGDDENQNDNTDRLLGVQSENIGHFRASEALVFRRANYRSTVIFYQIKPTHWYIFFDFFIHMVTTDHRGC